MNFKLLLLITSLLTCIETFCQPSKWINKEYFTVVSYNVENLFDTIDTPYKNDAEFTPEGIKRWNTERYNKKIESLSYVLSEINKEELPELIGLIEVENEYPLRDLIASENLKAGQYKYIVEDGPDPRGIDCALLYRPSAFQYITHKAIAVRFPFSNNSRTRDILYVKGLVNKDTVHVFVNHWSSRRGGQEKSDPKRVQSATVLKAFVDSIQKQNKASNIIIMGDFNDEPNNTSVRDALRAGREADNKSLTNLVYSLFDEGKGSYYYRGNYNMLDHMIVNSSMFSKTKGFRLIEKQAFIYQADTICYTFKNGDKGPSKTYGGTNYYGGFSDHFPIYSIFHEK